MMDAEMDACKEGRMEGRIGGMTDGQGKPSDGCCCTVQVALSD